ncbi:MAG TPA: efflux RND transporter permease subunit [Deltaproteobacteria bacterium]|nr:efflux RND transporter permease subunit [Deltaproteobacteria bacterium]
MNFFRFVIRYARIFMLLVIILPVVAGVVAYQNMPKEGSPEVVVPVALIITSYVGASPIEVESLVTNRLEDYLSNLSDMKEMRSYSAAGVSIIVTEFDIEADMEQMLQKIRDKVSDARKELPDDIEEPEIEEINFSDIPILITSLVGDMDPVRLKRLAEDVADELKLLPEVLDTDVSGGLSREIFIYVDPDRLNQYGVTILDVVAALRKSDVSIPAGEVTISKRKFVVRTFAEVKQVGDYAFIPIIEQGTRVVFLRDVADIVDGHDENISYARVQGQSSVTLSVKKRSGANILETSRKVRDKLAELEQTFPNGVYAVVTADQAKYIKEGFEIMNNSAVTGLIIVIIVLYFAMGLRNSIITSFSIPLSLLMSFIFLNMFGITNNDMVRFSLVLCIGLLVDNAIIVVESAYHHYQLGKDRVTAIVDGVSEVALPVISATLTTISAFLPMLLMTGVTGKFMGFMPKTVSIALASSLIVALIANPLILSRFMHRSVKDGTIVGPEEDLKQLKRHYERLVIWALNHRFVIVMIVTISMLSVGALFYFKIVKIEMFPDADFDYIYITVETPPGSDVGVTDEAAREVEKIITDHVPEAVRVVSTVGFKAPSAYELSIGSGESNFAEITIELMEGKEFKRAGHKEIQKRIRPLLDAIPGAMVRFRPLEWGPPVGSPITVKIFGHDLSVLNQISNDIKSMLADIPGAVEIKDDFQNAMPELRVLVDRPRAASLGVPLIDVSRTLRGATAGLDIKDFRDELDVSKKYDLTVRFSPHVRTGVEMMDKIMVRSINGSLVPLSNFVTIAQGQGVNSIRHIDRRRVVRITGQNQDRSAVEITRDLQEQVSRYQMPAGYSVSFAGDIQETEESFGSLKLAYLVSFILILTLLVAQFNSFFQPFAIIFALPLSILGAMVGLLVTGNNFSIMSFIGLVGLGGIVVNDSIVLVDRINRLRRSGRDMYEAVVAAGRHRLRPIISTTLTTMGGLVTLTITDELWEGLGVVIIFGIAFATLLTLIVVPVMYSLFEAIHYQMVSALRGPRWKDPRRGRRFHFSHRRWARTKLAVIVAVQAVTVLFLFVKTDLATWIISTYQSKVIQAPTIFKTVVEAIVFFLNLLVQYGGLALALSIPTLLGLLYLMYIRSHEGYYIEVSTQGFTMTSAIEKLFIPANELSAVRLSPLTRSLIVTAGPRRLRITTVVEDEHVPDTISLHDWLMSPPPTRRRISHDKQSLHDALRRIMHNG